MQWILHGDRRPGETINVQELSRQFAVSAAAVRDYLNRLRQFGLLDRRPNGAWVLNGFTGPFAEDLCEVRAMFELRSALRFVGLPPDDPAWAQLERISRIMSLCSPRPRPIFRLLRPRRTLSPLRQRRLAQPVHRKLLRSDLDGLSLPLPMEQAGRARAKHRGDARASDLYRRAAKTRRRRGRPKLQGRIWRPPGERCCRPCIGRGGDRPKVRLSPGRPSEEKPMQEPSNTPPAPGRPYSA